MTVFKLSDLDLVSDDRNYPYTTGHLPKIVTKTHDDNFVIADRVSNGTDSSLVITKFTPSGQIIFSKRYDQLKNHFISQIKDDNGSLMFLGRRYTGEKDMTHQFETLLMRTDNNGLVIENGTGYCHTVPNSVRVDPAKFTEAPWYNPPPTSAGQVVSKTITLLERYFTMNVLAGCSTIGDC